MTPAELDALAACVDRLERIVASLKAVDKVHTDAELNALLKELRQAVESIP